MEEERTAKRKGSICHLVLPSTECQQSTGTLWCVSQSFRKLCYLLLSTLQHLFPGIGFLPRFVLEQMVCYRWHKVLWDEWPASHRPTKKWRTDGWRQQL